MSYADIRMLTQDKRMFTNIIRLKKNLKKALLRINLALIL